MTAKKRSISASRGVPNAKKQRVGLQTKGSQVVPGSMAQSLKSKGKQKVVDRVFVPIPNQDDADAELSENDTDLVEKYGDSIMFLDQLDYRGIARSKLETEKLGQLTKPIRKVPVVDDLPSLDSDSGEEEEAWSSGLEGVSLDGEEDTDSDGNGGFPLDDISDIEMPYERKPRELPPSWKPRPSNEVESLPIKLADGRIVKSGSKKLQATSDEDTKSKESSQFHSTVPSETRDDVATGSRFGRVAVVNIIGNASRAARLRGAKEQIASLCQEIISDPENSLGLLRRLHTFSLAQITSPTHPEPLANDIVIRKLAILSQLTVFKDVIPGYRIRALTDKETAEKVSQMVAHTREWEQGLVNAYQTYLQALEKEIKAKSELSSPALRCMCSLLSDVTHFNFRVNLMHTIVAVLSRKRWDESSDLCLDTLIKVFRDDLTGQPSLELVRLLNRMIKERRFNVHPNVLTCLLSLRLKSELGVRASDSKSSTNDASMKRKKEKKTDKHHLSKKARKLLKERKEIEREFRDAEAEVDKEERATTQTETLKLLFVLYFRILKNERPSPLLPAALRGISRFAHLVNIDFFKDLMQVLKNLILRDDGGSVFGVPDPSSALIEYHNIQHKLLCIITAFELLSGQGEALNLDLNEFVTCLYAEILPSTIIPDTEAIPPRRSPTLHHHRDASTESSLSDLLFHALSLVFCGKAGGSSPPWRSAAFGKRLLSACLHWPPSTALRALEFVHSLVAKDPKLEALLSTDDRAFDGVYRPDIDDPQLCNPFGTAFWELSLLATCHCDATVRQEARKLMQFSQS